MDRNDIARKKESPFLLKLFYRTGAFHRLVLYLLLNVLRKQESHTQLHCSAMKLHTNITHRPDEFSHHTLPPHIDIHTWPTATLAELSYHIANHSRQKPSLLPEPAVGTRIAFRLVYRDPNSRALHQFVVKDLGSLVLGGEDVADLNDVDNVNIDDDLRLPESPDAHKTLSDAKFIVGDYLSCAILPPLEDGSVAPADSARSGRGSGVGEARWDDDPVPSRGIRGYGMQHSRGGGGGDRYGGVGWSGRGGRSRGGPGGGGLIPMGEWRRGEKLPEVPGAARSRGGWSRDRGKYP